MNKKSKLWNKAMDIIKKYYMNNIIYPNKTLISCSDGHLFLFGVYYWGVD